MTDTPTPPYPVRDPAPGPVVVLDLPALWSAVVEAMTQRGMTTIKELADLTGLDRNTLGRTKARAEAHQIVRGQRGGLNVNAYITLATFASGRLARHGQWALHANQNTVTGAGDPWAVVDNTED